MKRTLIVQINTDQKDSVKAGPVRQFENEQIQPDLILDMACFCEKESSAEN